MDRRTVQALAVLGSCGLAVGALALALRDVSADAVHAAIGAARWDRFPLLLGMFTANHLLRIGRYHLLLGPGVRLRSTVAACLGGFLAMSTLPLRLGELVRPGWLARDGVPLSRSVVAALIERLLDLAALLALLAWVGLGLELPSTVVVQGVDVVAAAQRAAAVGALGLGGALVALAALGERVAAVPIAGRVASSLATALKAAEPRRTAAAAALTLGTWSTAAAYVWAALRLFPDLPASIDAATVAWAAMISAVTVLPTPGFVGSYEAGAVEALRLYGADPGVAAACALLLHVSYVGFIAAVGLPALATAPRAPGA